MELNEIIKRVHSILVKPKTEWQNIKTEVTTVEEIYTKYAIFLAAIPALSAFIGYYFFGMPSSEGVIKLTLSTNVRWAILSYGISLSSIYALAYIIDLLSPYFGSQRHLVASLKVVIYSHTASWLSGIFFIIPQLTFLSVIASLYSLYLLYTGMKIVKEVPQHKLSGFFAAIIIASIFLSLVSILIAGMFLPMSTIQVK